MSKSKKIRDVKKFGGVDELGQVRMEDNHYEVNSIEAKSDINLESDTGTGGSAIVRQFTFLVNRQAFEEARPTKQDLFNYHIKGLEMMLWRDGLKLMTEVQPKIIVKETEYTIIVGAKPMNGHILQEAPKKLKELING